MPTARITDPLTSHLAAQSVANLEATKLVIKYLLMTPKTDQELIEDYTGGALLGKWPKASESGIRTRRSELVDAGEVKPTGEKRKTESGRSANVWCLVEMPVETLW
jgi:hypothetical protein